MIKKLLAIAATLFILATPAEAAVTFPINGGTGSTTLSGILKGNGTSPVVTALPGIDYLVNITGLLTNGTGIGLSGSGTTVSPYSISNTGVLSIGGLTGTVATSSLGLAPNTSGSSILYGNGSGGFSNATVGTGLSFTGGTLSSTGSGSGTVSTSSSETAGYFPTWTSTNGTPALLAGTSQIFQSGSNVGIGTTTPQQALSIGNGILGVNRNSAAPAVLLLENGVGVGQFRGDSSLGGYGLSDTSGNFKLFTKQSNGFIGIGTTSPTYPLSIETSNSGSGVLQLMNMSSTGYDSIDFFNSLGSQVGGFGYGNTGTGVYPNQVYFYSSGKDLVFGNSGGANDMVVSGSTGYLGLNATSPAARLDVRPTAVNAAVTPAAYFVNPGSGTLTGASVLAGYNETAAATAGFSGYYNGAGMSLGLIAQGSEFATLTQLGNFGIGSTSPGTILSVGTTNGINFSTATSTFYSTGGINLTSGCYAIAGTCIGSSGSGTVTSISGSGGTTGLTLTGGPITTTGTLTLGGTLGAANGGTGSTTLSGILKGNGTGQVLTAVPGTDYVIPTGFGGSLTGVVYFVKQTNGTSQAGGITLATSSTSFNGLTVGNTITNTLGTFTFTPSLSGTLGIGGGGTGLSSIGASSTVLTSNGTTASWQAIATGSGTVGSGLTGQFPYYAANGTTLTATSTLFLATTGNIGVGTTSPSKLFTVEGNQSGGVMRVQRDYPSPPVSSSIGTYDVSLNELTTSLADQTGPTQTFGAMLNGGSENIQADIGSLRDGTDTNGAFEIRTYNAGNPVQALIINHLGYVGIGTTSPIATLDVASSTGEQLALSDGSATDASWGFRNAGGVLYVGTTTTSGATSTTGVSLASSANTFIGIATTSPWRTLSVTGTVAMQGLSTAAGTVDGVCINAITFELEANTSASCTVSSKRFKHDIQAIPTEDGLDALMQLKPSSFIYNGATTTMYGFVAEDVASVTPATLGSNLVGYDSEGRVNSIDDIGLSAVTVKAIQEQQQEILSMKLFHDVQDMPQDVFIGLLILGFAWQQWQIQKLKRRV